MAWEVRSPERLRQLEQLQYAAGRIKAPKLTNRIQGHVFSTGLEWSEWNETTRGRLFHSQASCAHVEFQATEQPT